MATTLLIKLFLQLLKLVQHQNPLLLLSSDEPMPEQFCSGISAPITCVRYELEDIPLILNYIESSRCSPIFMSYGDHKKLIMEMGVSNNPNLFSKSTMWFMPLENESNIPLRLDSRVFLYGREHLQGSNLTIWNSYAIKGGPPITKPLFTWSPEQTMNINIFEKKVTLRNRANLNGVVLKNSWFEQHPFVVYDRDDAGNVKSTAGFYSGILSELATTLNFTIKHIPAPPGWGAKSKNGTWNGLMGRLVKREIDMSANIGQTLQRQNYVDFLWPTFIRRMTLITSSKSKAKLDMWTYMKIFRVTAWVTTISCIIISAILFALANDQPLLQGFAMMLRLFIQLGYNLKLNNSAAKLLLFSCAISCYLIFALFCADLTGRMTSDPEPLNIGSFQDAIDQDYRVITYGKGLPLFYFKTAPKGSAMRWVYENQMLGDDTAILEDYNRIFSMVKEEPKTLVYLVHNSHSKEPRWQNLQGLDIEEKVNIMISIALQKDSEFAELFDHHLIKMQEKGILDRIRHEWTDGKDQDYSIFQAGSLDIQNTAFGFVCFVLGIFIAAQVILAEWIYSKCVNSKQFSQDVKQVLGFRE